MEESLLSTDYKKHIQVQGDVGPVASAEECQGGDLLQGAGPKPGVLLLWILRACGGALARGYKSILGHAELHLAHWGHV